MTACEILLSGCDDVTRFALDLDDAQIALLQRVAARSEEVSAFSCQPRMTITLNPPDEAVPF